MRLNSIPVAEVCATYCELGQSRRMKGDLPIQARSLDIDDSASSACDVALGLIAPES
jgi:hypothetical protein